MRTHEDTFVSAWCYFLTSKSRGTNAHTWTPYARCHEKRCCPATMCPREWTHAALCKPHSNPASYLPLPPPPPPPPGRSISCLAASSPVTNAPLPGSQLATRNTYPLTHTHAHETLASSPADRLKHSADRLTASAEPRVWKKEFRVARGVTFWSRSRVNCQRRGFPRWVGEGDLSEKHRDGRRCQDAGAEQRLQGRSLWCRRCWQVLPRPEIRQRHVSRMLRAHDRGHLQTGKFTIDNCVCACGCTRSLFWHCFLSWSFDFGLTGVR